MRRIGRVLHISSSKNLIVKAENLPKMGGKVVDEFLKPVGTVFDIFGPCSSPYVAVKSRAKDSDRLVGHVLYAYQPKGKKRKKV